MKQGKRLFLGILIFLGPISVWAGELREVKPPEEYPLNPLWLYLFFGIAILGIFFLIIRMYQNFIRANRPPPITQSPWEIAYERLEKLQARELLIQGQFKEYYTILCDILRRYCEERFSIKASEMTTEEFLIYLQHSQVFNGQQQRLWKEFLEACDMVKFAKYAPAMAEGEQGFHIAKKIIDETKAPISFQNIET